MNNLEQKKLKVAEALFGTIIILAFLFIALFANQVKSLFGIGETHVATNTITVNGTGKVTAIPDIATFEFTVSQTAATVAAAQAAATTQLNSAYNALTSAGVASSDIQTTSYNINPNYTDQNGVCDGVGICTPTKSVLDGYTVSQTDQVKVRNLANAGSLFTTIGSLGIESVDSLQFSLDNPETVQNEARATAISDAQTQAQTLANELGVKLVAVVGFSDNSSSPTPSPVMYAMNAMVGTAAASPTVSTGQQQITDNVTVTYEIR